METLSDLKHHLQQIIASAEPEKSILITRYQRFIWEEEVAFSEECNDVLKELAYDMDFYEPVLALQKEDAIYFGEDKLHAVIGEALYKLNMV